MLIVIDEVWMWVYDVDNKMLYFGMMKFGEKFDVLCDVNNLMINVGWFDKLMVMLNGLNVLLLGIGECVIKDVWVGV